MTSQASSVQVSSVQVLSASVSDVRHFAALLRGVNFANRATVTVTESGFTITVEESRTLLGTAYVFQDMFEEYVYHPELGPSQATQQPTQTKTTAETTAFEIPLNTLIECLNIFGTAGSVGTTKTKKWRKAGEDDVQDVGDEDRSGPIDRFFGTEKGTALRMSYAGTGYPLTLFVAEDASGPTATCEITTYEPEPHMELPFEGESTVLKIILKSSWLRDALSELDPSYDKITLIGNPPDQNPRSRSARAPIKPMLRIQAAGTFGSTELDYPNDREVLETFECSQNVKFTYRFAHISRSLRALQTSSKTSLRIDAEGLLSLQLLMPTPRPRGGGTSNAFTEFRCLPLEDDS